MGLTDIHMTSEKNDEKRELSFAFGVAGNLVLIVCLVSYGRWPG